MSSFKVLSVVLFIHTVLAEEGIVKSCAHEDMECINESSKLFFEKTSAGIPEYDIKPEDPMVIPAWDIDVSNGVSIRYRNLNITGLKDRKISNFKLDPETKTIQFTTSTDLYIHSDMTAIVDKVESSAMSGTYSAEASVKVTAKYNYELKKDDKGVEHFEIGPETLTCEPLSEVKLRLSPELAQAVANDKTLQKRLKENKTNLVEERQKLVCKIAEEAYKIVIQNIRAAAKVVPKSAFFSNV